MPLLLAKLYTVYPRLFTWPPARDVGHGVERLSLLFLVGGSLVQIATGVMNVAGWYAFGFFFTAVHYWSAWVVIGSLVVHIGAKLTQTRRALSRAGRTADPEPDGPGLSRRGFLMAAGTASGVLVVATAGQTVAPLSRLSVLAPRVPEIGPQGVPVNKTAQAARIARVDDSYRLLLTGRRQVALSLDDLRALPQRTAVLPIACVEGWSASASWNGVEVRQLLSLLDEDVDAGSELTVVSLQQSGRYRTSTLTADSVRDPFALLALRLNGEPLHLDHGYPLRLIAPNRPGVLQTKWVQELRLS